MNTFKINTLSEDKYKSMEESSILSTQLYIVDDNKDDHRTVIPSYDLLKEYDKKILTAKKEAIAYAEAEFAKIKEFKVDPVKCKYDEAKWNAAGGGRACAYGNGIFVICPINADNYESGKWCYSLSSVDGINFEPVWSESQITIEGKGYTRFNCIAFDDKNKIWYAGRYGIFKSTDLIHWENTAFPSNKPAVITIIDGDVFVGFETETGDKTVGLLVSKDQGKSYEVVCNKFAIGHVAKHGNTIVGATRYDTATTLPKGVFISHDNGKTWKDISNNLMPKLDGNLCGGLKFFNNVFVLKGNSATSPAYWSEDGETWNLADTPKTWFYNYEIISDPDELFIAALPYDTNGKKMVLTVDGKKWYEVSGSDGYFGFASAWSRNGIVSCGNNTNYKPFFLKNIGTDYKVNSIQTTLLQHKDLIKKDFESITVGDLAKVIVDLINRMNIADEN